ncbi:MAG: glycosyltransferase family 4 protein [bacterium]
MEMHQPMKMLYLSMYDPHVPYTGAGARGAQFVNYLSQHYNVDLIYMEGSGHPGNPEFESMFSDRIHGVNDSLRIPFSEWGYFVFSKTLYCEAKKKLSENRYDFILADYGLSAIYGCMLSKKFNLPFIYSSHNIEFRQYLGKTKSDFRRWPLVPYVYYAEKKGCKEACIVVTVSEIDALFYSKWIPREKIVVVPQGFDETVYNPYYESSKNDPRIVLFFGNYGISTNRDAVKIIRDRIVEEVVRKVPNIKFQFVGANPPEQYAHPNFEFTGFVESLEPYIKKADLVISPLSGGWGMPTKIIESLACGKRVIATEVGARTVSKNYKRLIVCEIHGFPVEIVKTLEEDRPVDASDFHLLKKDYMWKSRLPGLKEKIEQIQKAVST